MSLLKRSDKKKGFISLANANRNHRIAKHNDNIERVVYSSSNITKPLFFIGSVLPDFKISWVVLVVYIVVKYPIKTRIVISNAIRELKTDLSFIYYKGGFFKKW